MGESSNPTRSKRTIASLVIEPFKQVRLGLYVIAISMAFVIASAYMFVAAFAAQYQHVMGIFNIVDPDLKWELITNDVFYTNAIRLGILLVSFVLVLLAVVFRMTHKVYGPLVSIERFVEQMGEGRYDQRIVIRGSDDLQRLVHKLNLMAEEIERREASHAPSGEAVRPTDRAS